MVRRTTPRPLLVVLCAVLATSPVCARDASDLRADYDAVWTRLVATQVEPGTSEQAVGRSDELGLAWQLMGEWLATTLRRRPDATAEDVRAALRALNTEDVAAACRTEGGEEDDDYGEFFCRFTRFAIDAEAMQIEPAPHATFAVAVRYSYFGRLLIVAADGLAASEEIGRCGVFDALPDLAGGGRRFLVYSRCDDWPTSCCGGGSYGVWHWQHGRLTRHAGRQFRAPRPGCTDDSRWDRVLFRRGRWMKLYTRNTRRLFDGCSGTALKSVCKIRLDGAGTRDLGCRIVVPELEAADRLIDRALRGSKTEPLATKAAAKRLAELLHAGRPFGLLDDYRVTRTPPRSRLVVFAEPSLAFTFEDHRGRLHAVDVEPAAAEDEPDRQPPLTGGNTATSSPSASR